MVARKQKKNKYSKKAKPASGGLFARRGLMLIVVLVALSLSLLAVYKLCALTGSLFLSRNDHFTIQTIDMTSDGRLTPSKLMEYADVRPGQNLFALDLGEIEKNLKTVPLIDRVQIKRKLPDTLMIRVIERVAVAQIRWTYRGMPFLMDRDGIVLPATRSGQALPVLEGMELEKLRPGEQVDVPGVQYVLELLNASDALGLGAQVRFTNFDLRYPDFITVQLNEDVTARFPRHSAREKLIRLVRVLQIAREQGRQIKTVDLTPDGRNVPTTYR